MGKVFRSVSSSICHRNTFLSFQALYQFDSVPLVFTVNRTHYYTTSNFQDWILIYLCNSVFIRCHLLLLYALLEMFVHRNVIISQKDVVHLCACL